MRKTKDQSPKSKVEGRGPGRLIALEGLDGSGKTTQARLLADRLTAGTGPSGTGRRVHLTAEPSRGPIGRLIRDLIAVPPGAERTTPPDPFALALLFAADRRDHLIREIEPALRRGEWVVCDRYVLSSLAYQGGRGIGNGGRGPGTGDRGPSGDTGSLAVGSAVAATRRGTPSPPPSPRGRGEDLTPRPSPARRGEREDASLASPPPPSEEGVGGRGPSSQEWVALINGFARPADLTVYLRLSVRACLERLGDRPERADVFESAAQLRRIGRSYRSGMRSLIAAGWSLVEVDAAGPVDRVAERIWAKVSRTLACAVIHGRTPD